MKVENIINKKKNDEIIKQEQADSSNVNSNNDTKSITNEVETEDSNEAEAKEINTAKDVANDEAVLNSDENNENEVSNILSDQVQSEPEIKCDEVKNSSSILKNENNEIKQNSDIKDVINHDSKTENNITASKITPNEHIDDKNEELSETKSKDIVDEDYIQDEELDHEVDEEDIKASTDVFEQIDNLVSVIISKKKFLRYHLMIFMIKKNNTAMGLLVLVQDALN